MGLMTEAAYERWRSGGDLLDRLRSFFRLDG